MIRSVQKPFQKSYIIKTWPSVVEKNKRYSNHYDYDYYYYFMTLGINDPEGGKNIKLIKNENSIIIIIIITPLDTRTQRQLFTIDSGFWLLERFATSPAC